MLPSTFTFSSTLTRTSPALLPFFHSHFSFTLTISSPGCFCSTRSLPIFFPLLRFLQLFAKYPVNFPLYTPPQSSLYSSPLLPCKFPSLYPTSVYFILSPVHATIDFPLYPTTSVYPFLYCLSFYPTLVYYSLFNPTMSNSPSSLLQSMPYSNPLPYPVDLPFFPISLFSLLYGLYPPYPLSFSLSLSLGQRQMFNYLHIAQEISTLTFP